MTLRKKIFGSLFVLVCLAIVVGGVYWWLAGSQPVNEDVLNEIASDWPEVDLSISPLGELVLPEINLDITLNLSDASMIVDIPPAFSAEDFESQMGQPDIPSISFSPAEIQDLMPGS